MSTKPDNLKMLISKYKSMNIEELEANIEHLESETDSFHQFQSLDIAKNELKIKYKERQEQIEILKKSLTSSSRIRRWISSTKAVIKQLIEF